MEEAGRGEGEGEIAVEKLFVDQQVGGGVGSWLGAAGLRDLLFGSTH